MKKDMFRKIFVLGLMICLVCIVPNSSGDTKNIKNVYNQSSTNENVLFYDDFNDNSKDYSKWTELYSDGDWWERNQQTEFKCHETVPTSREGIYSKDIPVSINNNILSIECVMDTFIDNYPDQTWQYVGAPHITIVDSNDPDDKYIDVYYSRNYNQIRLKDSEGTSTVIGNSNEFRENVVITLLKNKYIVDIGHHSSEWISKSIFSSDFDLQVQLSIFLNGDYSNQWWIAGFDDVYVIERENNPPEIPIINGPPSGKAGEVITYAFICDDPENDFIYYEISWGDGTFAEWVGPYESNEVVSIYHIWEEPKKYTIMARAKDYYDDIGEWGKLEIEIPRNIDKNYLLFQRIFDRLPNAFPILRHMLGALNLLL